ncbi:MAG: Holliday junction resolvase RuvX [Nevskiaceae bacterium]|jgi:putative Holliday junction resolvase|nr:Holliday junction resolvase RuvX [Nevskiaceae bacterium]
MPETSAPRVVLAFDFGLKRIGIASGETMIGTCAPRGTVAMTAAGPEWPAIDRIVRDLAPNLLLVGAPYNDDGSPARIAPQATAFADALSQRYGLPVQRVDERYSSTTAESRLREQRASGERRRAVRKGDIDSAAAAVILGSWLAQSGR